MSLALKKCIPCPDGATPLPLVQIESLMGEISQDWEAIFEGTRLCRKIKLKNFASSLKLANEIGEMAESEWHHPELVLGFGYLNVEIYTHKIGGLLESDFIFAAKVDVLVDRSRE